MAGFDRIIDPKTKDYVRNETGGYLQTDTIGTKIYLQMTIQLNGWFGDATAGSNMHLAKNFGAGAEGIAFSENAVFTALDRFIVDGTARDLRVKATADGNRVSTVASMTDIQGAQVSVEGVTPFKG